MPPPTLHQPRVVPNGNARYLGIAAQGYLTSCLGGDHMYIEKEGGCGWNFPSFPNPRCWLWEQVSLTSGLHILEPPGTTGAGQQSACLAHIKLWVLSLALHTQAWWHMSVIPAHRRWRKKFWSSRLCWATENPPLAQKGKKEVLLCCCRCVARVSGWRESQGGGVSG